VNRSALLALPVLLSATLCSCRLDHDDLDVMQAGIEQRFPDVDSLPTNELATWLAHGDSTRPELPVLLDVRARIEFDVSHLPGARHAPTVSVALQTLHGAAVDTPIVTYCSVGYRSAVVAHELQAQGYTRVLNLRGSLFQWANEGRGMVNDDGPVSWVHPYGSPWSGLLQEKYHWRPATEPPATGPTE